MSEKPILMTAENYRKCADGTKTQTRRVIVPQPQIKTTVDGLDDYVLWKGLSEDFLSDLEQLAPYPVGTRLWVKEPFQITSNVELCGRYPRVIYKHDGTYAEKELTNEECEKLAQWSRPDKGKSALFMFKSLARLWLEVTAVRVERLQDISNEDSILEGIEKVASNPYGITERTLFRDLWDSINKDRAPWSSNPWVWVYTFRRSRK